jgi:hypothetical protein
MPDPIPVEGPVELIDGKLILRIPLDMGGVGMAAFALGIGAVDSEHLNVAIQPWLAEKLRIGPGSIVCASVDTANGNFSITRSAAGDERLGQRRNYWMLSSSRTRTTKWLAALNASAAVAAAAVLPISWLAYLTAALFGLAAAAHWRRWPLWWLVQGMAVALPLVIILLSLT